MAGINIFLVIILLSFGPLSTECNAQSGEDLIIRTMDYEDQNPIHSTETNEIKRIFIDLLRKGIRSDKTNESKYLPDQFFQKIYENSQEDYEDLADYRRGKIRGAYCYASLALISKAIGSEIYMQYAILSLQNNIEKPDIELVENQFLGLLILDISLKIKKGRSVVEEINRLEIFLQQNTSIIPVYIKAETKELIERYKVKM